MRVAITGVTGLIGSALRASLEADDHEVMAISRRDEVSSLQTVTWDVTGQRFDPAPLEGIGAVIHLAGEPIDQRWTEVRQEEDPQQPRRDRRSSAYTATRAAPME